MDEQKTSQTCLSDEQLRHIVEHGEFEDSRSASHLDTCSYCKARLDDLTNTAILKPFHDIANSAEFQAAYFGLEPSTFDPNFKSSFGRYRIESPIGAGGMGTVYRAFDQEFGRTVAIKILRNVDSPTARSRFEREARSLSKLDHPHVVPVHTSGTSRNGHPYLVMQLIEGLSLKEVLQQKQIEPKEAGRLIAQIASGLHSAHQMGLIHRDVKPGNILVDAKDHKAMLVDFGLVRGVDDRTLTQTQVLSGTPEYMSPEQTNHFEKTDARSDIYSLGITLYECLTGSVPFRGRPLDVLAQHRDLDPVPPSRLNKNVPRDLETICLKVIDKEPSRRYATAEAFANDLNSFIAGRPITARPIGQIQKGWRWALRNRALATAHTLLVVTLLSGIIASTLLWLRSERNAGLAKARNESLLASQKVLRNNQDVLRESLKTTFHDSIRNRDDFLQLPTSVRNTTLIAMRQASELIFKTSGADSQALREVVDDLNAASQLALTVQMELRATELGGLNRQVVDRVLELTEGDPSARDLLRAALVHNQFADAQRILLSLGYQDQKRASDAKEAYATARRFSEMAGIEARRSNQDDLAELAEIQLFRAQCGSINRSGTLDQPKKLVQLESLAAKIENAGKSEGYRNQWLSLQEGLSHELARLSPASQAIEYRRLRSEQLQSLAKWNSEQNGKTDSWILRNHAKNQVQLGAEYAGSGEPEMARQCYQSALEQFQGLTELYALNGYYRAGYFETLVLLADFDWKNNARRSALQLGEKALFQIQLLVRMNPQDPNLVRRAAAVHGEWGEHLQELGRFEEAGNTFLKASQHSKNSAANLFKVNSNNSQFDHERAIELLTKAIAAFEAADLTEQAASARETLKQLKSQI